MQSHEKVSAAAYQANDQPVDRATFYALACDPRRSVVVEACAGAGKTWMLVSRILRALLDGAQPQEILAITFTRKAAGEMRARLAEWLREFAAPRANDATRVQALLERGVTPMQAQALAPQLAGLHERILRSGHAVQVHTFHAWFAQLLRAAPLELLAELGLQPEMELIEDLSDHRTEVLRRFHAAILREPSLERDHAQLVAQRGRHQASAWFTAVLDKRVEIELAAAAGTLDASVPLPASALDGGHPAAALLETDWPQTLRELMQSLTVGGVNAQEAAARLAQALAQTDPRACFDRAWRALFNADDEPRKKLGKAATLAAVQQRLALLRDEVDQYDAYHEHGRMARLSRVLLAELAAYKTRRGLIDMTDLERCGLALLRDASLAAWVQERLDSRVRHVLIDEFQDTSPLQWQALHAWLSGYAGAGGGASGQRMPGVFIVGDPKQSIYRFRRAEPRVFEAARHFVTEGLDGVALACDHTRRNAPEVLAALNAVFEQARRDGAYEGFRLHTTELEETADAAVLRLDRVPRPPSTGPASATAAEWRDSLTTPRHQPDEVLREREAAQVASAIHQLLAGPAQRPGDIYVLCRKRESLRLVAHALRAVGVPYAAPEETPLMEAPEARDLVALLDTLVSPAHRLSLAQALRSPLFGASDDDLIALARRAEGRDWWSALASEDAALAARAALQRARALLPRWREAAMHLPPHDLLDRIVHEGELRERVAATVPAVQRQVSLAAIDALLAQALTLDGARYATPYNFVRALKRRAIRVAAPAQADAVQLLTVHGAKGLEAKTVFVVDADPEAKNPETTTLLIDWPVDAAAPRCCAFVYSESACPPSLRPLLAVERQAREREELNGLYVAMSRAKERLVFSATQPWRPGAAGPSWWQRVDAVARPWGDLPETPSGAIPTPERILIRTIAPLPPREPVAAPEPRADTDATRLGKAVHRTLEWATAGTVGGMAGAATAATLAELARAAALEFDSEPGPTALHAGRILASPECTRFFGGDGLHWAGNEVPISAGGEVLRIDRLVHRAEAWWVLDYKLSHAPQELQGYREQLLRYREAMRELHPGRPVRCAFITGAGELVEIDAAAAPVPPMGAIGG